MKIKVEYTKRYFKTITKEVEVPNDVELNDRKDWILDNAIELFEDEITAASLHFEDDEVDFVSDPRTILLLGDFSFNHFYDELKLFKTDNEQKCLIRGIDMLHPFENRKNAYKEADDSNAPAWLILNEFNGEIAFETPEVEARFKTLLEINHVSYEQ